MKLKLLKHRDMRLSRLFPLVCLSIVFLLASCQTAPFLSLLAPNAISFPEEGGTQTVSFSTNSEWTVITSSSWIEVSPSSGNTTDGEVVVSVRCGQNTSYDPLRGTITIVADGLREFISVTQDARLSFPVELHFREGVELMCLIFRLMGAPEFEYAIPVVAESADTFFASMKDHEAIEIARECRRYGVSYDAVTAYGLHLLISDGGSISFNPFYVESTDSSFNRWPDYLKSMMLVALNDFYLQSKFHEWYQSLDPLRQKATDSFKRNCDIDYEWFDRFFGPKEDLSIQILLSFLIGNHNHGLSVDLANGSFLLSPIMGSIKQGNNGIPYYSSGIVGTVAHEFCHPYCNPLISKYWESMKDKANAVFTTVESQMISQAYSTPQIMMYETFVRACSTRYLITHGYDQSKEELIQYEESRGFMMVRSLVDVLEMREKNQAQYTTMDDFMPEIIKAINNFQL